MTKQVSGKSLARNVTDILDLSSQCFSLTSTITHVVQHEPEPRKRKEVLQFSRTLPCRGGGHSDRRLEKCATYGSGAITVVSPASSDVAPTVPSLLYICPANRGNAAAKIVRIAALHVRADTAADWYASTMYVMEDVNMK